jgi:hypothetical protein
MFLPDKFRLLLPRHRLHPRRQGRSSFRTKRWSISESGYQIELKTSASFLLSSAFRIYSHGAISRQPGVGTNA